MKTKNIFWIIAGFINLGTAFIHTIDGQSSLIDPILESNLSDEVKSQLLGVWHIVTIILFFTTYYILYVGFKRKAIQSITLIKFIGILYVIIAIPFVFSGFIYEMLVPQWVLLFPIGILVLFGISKEKPNANT